MMCTVPAPPPATFRRPIHVSAGETVDLSEGKRCAGAADNALVAGAAAAAADILATLRAKNADYAGADPDPFRCFTAAELVGVHPLRGLLVRMLDKVSRAANLVDTDPQVAGESLADAFRDLGGYSLIACAWLRDQERTLDE